MTDDRPSSAEHPAIDVVRDATFTRFVADEVVMMPLGRDLEVGFLQYGPIFTKQIDQDGYELTKTKNVVTEVARMRMDYPTFLRTVMEFLELGVTQGKIKVDAVQKSLAEWAAIAETNNKPGNE